MHAKYLEQVLRDRGIPTPPLRRLEQFVDSLTEEQIPVMEERLRKLSLGVERQEDLDVLLNGIDEHAPDAPAEAADPPAAPQNAAPPEPQRPTRTPKRSWEAEGPDGKLPADVVAMLRQHGLHVYATSAALKIELDTLRTGEAAGALQYTVQIDAAARPKAHASAFSAHKYDWSAKVPFQFTRRELPILAAYLLGLSGKKLTLTNHGPNADKCFEAEDQGSRLFVKVWHTGRAPIVLPVGAADVFAWGELCLVAMHLNRPSVSAEGHLALLRRIGRMEAAHA
jgi:hypothetical protein